MHCENLSIKQIQEGLANKEFSAVELAQSYLERIAKKDAKIEAYLEVSVDLALSQARAIDEKIAQKETLPPLAGVPCSIKDAILVKGLKCTAGSRILENYTAVYDATCVQKIKEEGCLILGKTNLDEFAMGSSTEHSAFKITKNPHDLNRVPGGSSGGSAAAVAADECVFSLGSDTGGSIRQPASFCSVVGLKPTYGAVSRYGLIAFASSLDQIGPLAKTVDDCEEVFDVIRGKDPKDSTSLNFQTTNYKLPTANLKVGIPKEYFGKGLDKGVRQIVEDKISQAQKMGAEIKEISLPHSQYALACYYIVATCEASANLARFDGLRYGKTNQRAKVKKQNLLEDYLVNRGEGFGEEVKRRIMLGTFALSSGYYDAYYLKAQKARALIAHDFEKAFEKVDFIFSPVSPCVAFKIGEKTSDPLQMYLSDIYTISVNLAGLPALSLPAGLSEKMPVGLQIIGPRFSEPAIFHLAKALDCRF